MFFNGAKLWILKVKAQQGWPPSGNLQLLPRHELLEIQKMALFGFPSVFLFCKKQEKTAPKSKMKWCN